MGGNPYNKKKERGGFHGAGGRGQPCERRGGSGGGRGGGRGGGAGGGRGAHPGGASRDDTVLEALLKLVFEKQQQAIYDPNTGMLNLMNLAKCEDLQKMQSSIDFNAANFCRTLVSVIQQKIGNPRFLNLNDNSIKTPNHFFRALTELSLHESIGGISLANNKIDNVDFVFGLSKFQNLQELVLSGNPVRNNEKLLVTLRKKIPSLLGLDGESIARQPLSLPWPTRPNYDNTQRYVLELVESNLLHQLSNKHYEPAMQLYSEQAWFSYSAKQDVLSSRVHGDHRDVQNDFARLKGDINTSSRSILEQHKITKELTHDRLAIVNKLKRNLYRETFTVLHQLNPSASVTFFEAPIIKVPTCIVTIHGRMMWQHPKLPQEEKIVCFDRTLALTFQGTWSISNDMLNLRPNCEDPLYFADSVTNLEKLERTIGIPKEVGAALVKQCTSDYDLGKLLNEIGSPQLLQECCRVANNNFDHAVLTARLANARQLDPQSAYSSLAAANFVMPQ